MELGPEEVERAVFAASLLLPGAGGSTGGREAGNGAGVPVDKKNNQGPEGPLNLPLPGGRLGLRFGVRPAAEDARAGLMPFAEATLVLKP